VTAEETQYTVGQVKELRRLLEQEMLLQLREFEKRTGMTVDQVQLDRTTVGRQSGRISQLQGVHISVTL